jgi:glycosyltransferase involved in cell wall biosynthesis
VSKRILFCTLNYFPAPTGGAEHQAQLQAEELARRGHEVHVVCPRWPGGVAGPINGVQVHRLFSITRRPFRHVSYLASLALYLIVSLRRFDLVHVHLANLQADLAAVICRLLGRPLYVKVAAGGKFGDVQRMGRVAWLTRHFGLRNANRVQVLSEEIAAELRGIGVEPRRLLHIPNGLDVERFRPADAATRVELRRRLSLPEDAVIVLFVGRLSTQKGVHDLYHVWQTTKPNATLVLVGSRHTVGAMDELPETPGVIVRDFTPNIVDYYHAADVFVLPSYAEGMSNAMLEAMACGLPSVATRIGAADEMVQDGSNGYLMQPGDREKLASSLGALIDDAAMRAAFSERAAAAIREQFSERAVVDRIEAAYDEMLTERGRVRAIAVARKESTP